MSKIAAYLSQIRKKEIAGALLLVMLISTPFLSFAKTKKIYVDDNATSTQDGSFDHPYKTIKEAMKHSNKSTEIHVLPGKYKENVDIKEGVEIYGDSEKTVTIEASDDNRAVIEMDNDTKINKVTVKGGKYGIEIDKNSKASIIKCVIKNNEKDGIRIKEGDVKKSKRVSISENTIKNNGRTGIYSEKRDLSIIDNEISNNNGDGIDLSAGTTMWFQDNNVKNNQGSGMKIVLDSSNILTKNNTYRNNNREGIEINAYGKSGRVDINKSRIHGNSRYGIARIKRATSSNSLWNGLTVQKNTSFWDNAKGSISQIIPIF